LLHYDVTFAQSARTNIKQKQYQKPFQLRAVYTIKLRGIVK